MRRIMPYIMRGRNESAVYIESNCDVTAAKQWLWDYNRAAPGQPCTLLYLFLYSVGLIIREFPQLDRFVSGCRIYQRQGSTASLMIKESLETDAPLYSVKLPLPEPDVTLADYSRRVAEILGNAADHQRRTEKETELLLQLPDILVRAVLAVRGLLDRWNLLPAMLLRDDPLYTSIFVSNIGSLGLPAGFHHLYEHGNCSGFVMIGSLRKAPVADWAGNLTIRDILPIRWTIDDRIADGFVCATALNKLQSYLENPAQILGSSESAALGKPLPPTAAENAPVLPSA